MTTPSFNRRTISASTLVGDKVRNPEGDQLGSIKEIMLDVGAGRVAYAVLDMGGFLGLGNRLFALPWSELQLDGETHEFVLDVPKERLANAPGFDQNNWPDFSNREWGEEIHSFYNSPPYWH